MLLDWLTAVVHSNGVVASAIILALISYAVKFGFYRKFDQVDIIVALSEIPAILTSASGSLLVGALYLPSKNTRMVATYLMASFLVLLLNIFFYRVIESRKLSLNENKIANTLFISLSYFFMITFSVAAAARAYGELMQ